MKLIDLDPKWVIYQDRRIGFTFFSPVQHASDRTRWRQACLAKPTSQELQDEIFGEECIQHCTPSCGWTIAGDIEGASFETMTVTPSIDGSAGGLWHGFITNGEMR